MCWDLTTGATVEHRCYDEDVKVLCIVGDRVFAASYRHGSAHAWRLPSCLLHFFDLCCQCDSIVVVEQVSKCAVHRPLMVAAHDSSVFIGCDEEVSEWDIETGVVTKLVEHTGRCFPCVLQ